MKKVFNVFGIILAVIFSLVLIPTLLLTPIWQGFSGLLEPAFIESVATEIVEEIDLSEISLNDPELMQELTEAGISPEAAEAILTSDTVRQAVQLLGHDFSQVLLGGFESSSLTEAELQRIVTENRDELVQILRLMEPQDSAALTDEQLGQALDMYVQSEGGALITELNAMMLQLQTDLHTEYAELMMLLQGPIVLTVLLGLIALLAVLIFLCRWPHQEGLLWLGIDAALASLPVLGIAVSIKGAQITDALTQGTGVPGGVFAPVLRHAGNTILIGGVILLAAAVLLIALFILLRDRRMKKAAAAAVSYESAAAADPFAPQLPEDSPLRDKAPADRSPWDNP